MDVEYTTVEDDEERCVVRDDTDDKNNNERDVQDVVDDEHASNVDTLLNKNVQ